ncbi:MAG TPA: hypothetical protein VFA53_09020 [Xanthobacteraceae bacterium]|nr:hypothetical protein [Xanthobacteraceae bacterium]
MRAGKNARTATATRAATGATKATTSTEQDVATLIELLKMEAELRPNAGAQTSQIDVLRQDQILLDMWPEACRRTGAGVREFPAAVIKLWKQKLGGTN